MFTQLLLILKQHTVYRQRRARACTHINHTYMYHSKSTVQLWSEQTSLFDSGPGNVPCLLLSLWLILFSSYEFLLFHMLQVQFHCQPIVLVFVDWSVNFYRRAQTNVCNGAAVQCTISFGRKSIELTCNENRR